MKKNLKSRIVISTLVALSGTGCGKANSSLQSQSAGKILCSVKNQLKNNGNYLDSVDTKAIQLKPLYGHVPLESKLSQDLGPVKDHELFEITVALGYRDSTKLQTELDDLYNPSSPKFHQFLSPNDFKDRFAPTEAQILQVKTALVANGFTLSDSGSSGILILASAPARTIEEFFHTEIHHFKDPKSHRIYSAPTFELQVPSDLPIRWVHGLDKQFQVRHHSIISTLEGTSKRQKSGMTPSAIKKAYSLNSSLDGTGQTLALVELDTYTESDITAYENHFNLRQVPLETRALSGASNTPGRGAPEVTLDIELMIALAPNARKILIYQGPNSAEGIIGVYNKIAQDHEAKVVSTSWGMPETNTPSSLLETEYAIFQQMAAQGQAFFAASGDSGAYDNSSQIAVDDPASQPYVVGVGGTHLSLSADGNYSGESTWADSSTGAGGGGGVSTIWRQPSWQSGVVSSNSKGSTSQRNVPDVSLNSDPKSGYAIFYDGKWQVAGGTSCAAPLWAAFTALVNQNRQNQGKSLLGFPSPALYSVGQSGNYHSALHDVADGSTNFYYPAVANYDEATGWGSFQGDSLIQALSQDPLPKTPTPGNGLNPPPTTGSQDNSNQNLGPVESCS